MGKTRILGTGLSGLVGSRVVELLKNKYSFENLSFDTGVDITDKIVIDKRISNSDAPFLIHMAAKTDVDGCEKDKLLEKNGAAWRVNVLGTENVASACARSGKTIIYISTDFVFDGTKTVYSEEDMPHPTNWYGQTKFEGEKIVQSTPYSVIARIAYPYRAQFVNKIDFFRSILTKLKNKQKIKAVVDHIATPTFIDDIAYALDTLISKKASGIFHLVGDQFISPYEAALIIAETFECEKNLIEKTTRQDYFTGRAKRPFRLTLANDKIAKLGFKMKSFTQGLEEIKKQLV